MCQAEITSKLNINVGSQLIRETTVGRWIELFTLVPFE